MAIAFVNKLGTQESGSTSLTNTYAPTSGNLLIIVGSQWQAGGTGTLSLSDTRGNTIPSPTVNFPWNSQGLITVWLIPNCIGGAGTLTLSSTRPAPDLNLDVYEYSGASLTAALDGTPATASSASLVNSLATGNITLANASSMLFSGVWDYHAATTLTSSAGFTQRLNNQNTDAETSVGVDQIAAGTGPFSNTFTISASGTGALGVFIIGIQAAAPPVPNPLLGLSSPLSGGTGITSTANQANTVTQIGQRAYASGVVTQLNCNVTSIGTATTLYLALYDINGNLLCGGQTPIAVGTNTVSISNGPHVSYGTRYFPVFQVDGSAVMTDNNVSFQRNQIANTTLPLPATLAVPGINQNPGAQIMWAAGTLDAGAQGTPLGGPSRVQYHWRS